MTTTHSFFAASPRNLEPLLAQELRDIGVPDPQPGRAGVSFRGPLELGYRVCLWSRVANRVILELSTFHAPDPDALYAGVRAVNWSDHLASDGSLAVRSHTRRSAIDHSHYAALRTKDAVVDQLRDATGERPSVDKRRPDIRISLHIDQDQATLGLDISGSSLHRRGWRAESGGSAPLKENLAAAILLRSGWPELGPAGAPLFDPLCGTGTFLIEGAFMAADIAPGLDREYFGFLSWRGHQPGVWRSLLQEARERREVGLRRLGPILGADRDHRAIERTQVHIRRAGLEPHITLTQRDLADTPDLGLDTPGLVVCNPPYGERVGEPEEVKALHARLGEVLIEHFMGWKAAVITGSKALGMAIPLRARKHYTVYNGALACKLLCFDVEPHRVYTG